MDKPDPSPHHKVSAQDTTAPFPAAAEYWSSAMTRSNLEAWRRRQFWKRIIWRLTSKATEFIKRILDIMLSVLALIVSLPIFVIFGILIKLEDGGPIFFKQMRVGKKGKIFAMWKFRSMVLHAEKLKEELRQDNIHGGDGVTFKIENDPRITRIGKFIRKYSIDEFPQFYNVFKGEMSLVGPRPPVPSEVSVYKAAHLRRLLVKPGLTCFWQVSGRSTIGFDDQVRLDIAYINSQGFWTDLKILIKTIPAILLGKGSY